MIKKMNSFEISEYLKDYGFEMVGCNDNSKVLYFRDMNIDHYGNPEKDYSLVVYPTFDKDVIAYGQFYSFMGFLPDVKGTFTSPTYPNLTTDVELECTAMAFEEDFKKILNAMVNRE